MLREVRVCDGYVYQFTERECVTIEKYFDSIRQFMNNTIVDKICCNIDCDHVELVAYYDAYLYENNYDEECEFSEIMFDEFGVNV